ncbi:unnamed protein product [Nippostrongylus brasiliensis]|uniref:Exostosin domain-containing protein n=1 Tax=Nippostrongylus brasiliensis TaxID=27835 RepID=A0A0N4Y7C5_NIPBR|nr:unnamed protein product [Nippostrongylus brasiliensis]
MVYCGNGSVAAELKMHENKQHTRLVEPFACDRVCSSGTHCEIVKGMPSCVPDQQELCAAVFCAGGECIEYNNTFGDVQIQTAISLAVHVPMVMFDTMEDASRRRDAKILTTGRF